MLRILETKKRPNGDGIVPPGRAVDRVSYATRGTDTAAPVAGAGSRTRSAPNEKTKALR
jgi:hypothetical protein